MAIKAVMLVTFCEGLFLKRLIAEMNFSAGVTQLVECNLSKVEVAGSSPASRSTFLKQ